jgi:hypothetical protein
MTSLYSLLIILIYYFFGIGLTLWITPPSKREYILLICPWIGYSYITIAAWIFYSHEWAVADTYGPWLVVPPLVFGYLGLRRLKKDNCRLSECLCSKNNYVLIAAFIGFLIPSICLIFNPNQPTTMSAGNNDIANYASMARYLKEFLRSSSEGFIGQCGQYKDLDLRRLLDSAYFGTAAVTAVCSSLLKCMPHHIQSLNVNISLGMSVLSIFLLTKNGLRFSYGLSMAVAVFYSLSPVIHFIAIQGFYSQVTAIGLMMLLFWSQLSSIAEGKTTRALASEIPLFCLFLWALFISYSPMIPFTCGLLIVQAAVMAALGRTIRNMYIALALCLSSFIFCAIVNAGRILEMVKLLLILRTDTGGWFMPLLWPDSLIGLIGKNFWMQNSSLATHIVPSIPIVFVLLMCMLRAYKVKRYELVSIGIIAALIYSGALFLAFGDSKDGIWGGYRSFKLLIFYSPLFLILLMSVFTLFDLFRKKVQMLLVLACGGALAINVLFAQSLFVRNMLMAKSVESRYEDLLAIDRDIRCRSVNILGSYWWDLAWKSYFLMHKRQYFETFTGAGRVQGPLLGEWDLENTGNAGVVEVASAGSETILINPWLRLRRAGEDRIKVTMGKGFYGSEGSHSWTGAAGKEFEIEIDNPCSRSIVDIVIECHPFMKGNRLSIALNGQSLDQGFSGSAYEASDVELKKGINTLSFISEMKPERIGPGDDRLVTYCLKKIKLTKKNATVVELEPNVGKKGNSSTAH